MSRPPAAAGSFGVAASELSVDARRLVVTGEARQGLARLTHHRGARGRPPSGSLERLGDRLERGFLRTQSSHRKKRQSCSAPAFGRTPAMLRCAGQ